MGTLLAGIAAFVFGVVSGAALLMDDVVDSCNTSHVFVMHHKAYICAEGEKQ